MPPTIVLVHGAFAESSSWNRVIDLLPAEPRVIVAANPLRRLATARRILEAAAPLRAAA